jgi:hypothetical protein
MTEAELTRRVVETAAKFLAARPVCVRTVSVTLQTIPVMMLPGWEIQGIRDAVDHAGRLGWNCRQGEYDGVIYTEFHAPKNNTL